MNKVKVCPVNPNHDISTNIYGDYVCIHCAERLSDLSPPTIPSNIMEKIKQGEYYGDATIKQTQNGKST